MMPWDWMGMVTIRSDTRRRTSISGTINRRPGSRTPTTRPSRNSTPRSYCFTIRTDNANPTSTSSTKTTRTVSHPLISYPFLPVPLAAGTSPSLAVGAHGAMADGSFLTLESSGGVAGPATPPFSTGRRVLTACRRDLRSTGAYLDALGRGLLHLGHHDLEHPVLERGLDLLGLDLSGQGDRAAEGAVAALDPVELLLGGVMREVPLALDGQQAVLQGDVEVVGLDPG